MKRPAILYHYPCPEGAFAALAAHLYFSLSPTASTSPPPLFFPNTVYSPLRVEDLPLNEIDSVYLLDFVGPPGFIDQLSPKVERTAAMKKSAILYHYPCPDGAFAALAAHLYFSLSLTANTSPPPLFFPNTVYSPLRVEDLPLNEIDNVYLLDFVGPPGFIEQLSPKVERIVVLDHHKTSLEMLGLGMSVSGNVVKVIDMERSGATLAYDYFKEKLFGGHVNGVKGGAFDEFQRVRRLFEYIEDADIWKWRLPNSKSFSSGLKDLNLEFDVNANPSLFQQLLLLDPDSVISQGITSLAHKQRLIDEVLDQSYEIAIGGGAFGHCLATNADSVSELRSELGHQLADKSLKMNLRGIGAVVYRVPELENDLLLKISLRSVHDEDTTPISQEYGGGGHRNASSFILNSTEFLKWKVSVN